MDAVQQVVVLPQEPVALIHPHLHGQFAEHLGLQVYPGIYVGPESPIPNTSGKLVFTKVNGDNTSKFGGIPESDLFSALPCETLVMQPFYAVTEQ